LTSFADIETETVKHPGLPRLVFMGFAPAQELIRMRETHLEKLR
jgi:hypothetical protein